ncbi:putative Phosphofurin acidic cluster sorting protein 2 [Hypsibius exemplaris]|uniref:Phosphofurin acidic cluster sorting protein 2 n=1 Tax=Hypsibius exemplaris TaxID=2072580 RepID=A0A1W0WJS9_HYPEX|nr:putative Phosphofurin acidic cluster sorting protein 2 [Hypsibius exemplaris]
MAERSFKAHVMGSGGGVSGGGGAFGASGAGAGGGSSSASGKVSMKLFAIGDVGRMPSFCTSRICSARLVRLVVNRRLEEGLRSITIAIKMQGSKRTLRSTELDLGINDTLDTEIDLSLSLQYPHYLKQRTNLLYIMLQRRKKYKNRRILGYKTLAVGTVDMTEVLQRSVDQELAMYASPKEKDAVVAKISIVGLSTQPVNSITGKESLEDDNTSDEDEFTSEGMSDSEGDVVVDEALGHGESSGKSRRKLQAGRHQANFKQKFISLLRKFKQSDGFDADVPELEEHDKAALDDELLDELDFDSDSGPDPEFMDTISVQSTPRPHLSPYFKPGRSLSTLLVPSKGLDRAAERSDDGSRNNSDSHPDTLTDEDGSAIKSDDQKEEVKRKRMLVLREKSSFLRDKEVREKLERKLEKEVVPPPLREFLKPEGRKFSQSIPVESSPKKAILDQLHHIFPSPEEDLPNSIVLINGNHALGQAMQEHLETIMNPVICTASTGDIKACFTQLATRFHKLHFGKVHSSVKVVVCGGDEFMNAVLRGFIEMDPPDLHSCLRFVFIPLGESTLSRYIGQADAIAGDLFDRDSWFSALEQPDPDSVDWDIILNKIRLYYEAASAPFSLPIAQAMINVKSHGGPEAESSQMFIPFLSDVRINAPQLDLSTSGPMANEGEDLLPHSLQSGASSASFINIASAGGSTSDMQKQQDFSPPHSPSVAQPQTLPYYSAITPLPQLVLATDAMELQLDFWTLGSSNEDREKDRERKKSDISRPKDLPSSKTSIKAAFRSIHVVRPVHGSSIFSLTYSTKEKKIQIMRALGKKAKDLEVRTVGVDGISRLICRICKVHGCGMKVAIDGCDWQNINFFQLSPQWHSNIKALPLLICESI